MAEVKTKVSGSIKNITEIATKVSSAWKTIISVWYKESGTWKKTFQAKLIPDNLIGFAEGPAPSGTTLCDGNNSTIDLIGKYLKVASTQGAADSGSNEHTHAYTGNTGSVSNTAGGDAGSGQYGMTAHSHTMNHTHEATNHEPVYKTLAPCIIGDSVPTDINFFFDGSVIPTGWSQNSSFDNSFIKSGTDGLTGGSDTHEHVFTGYSGYTNAETSNDSEEANDDVADDINHRHTINHTHTATNNIPEYYSMKLIKPTAVANSIPSGVCAFFLGNSIPSGWSYFSTAEGKFIRVESTQGNTGGSNTHEHVYTGTSGGYNPPAVDAYADANDYVTDSTHYHTINHTHAETDNQPLHRELLFCKKN